MVSGCSETALLSPCPVFPFAITCRNLARPGPWPTPQAQLLRAGGCCGLALPYPLPSLAPANQYMCASLAWRAPHSSVAPAHASGPRWALSCPVHLMPEPTPTVADRWSCLALSDQHLGLNHMLTSPAGAVSHHGGRGCPKFPHQTHSQISHVLAGARPLPSRVSPLHLLHPSLSMSLRLLWPSPPHTQFWVLLWVLQPGPTPLFSTPVPMGITTPALKQTRGDGSSTG